MKYAPGTCLTFDIKNDMYLTGMLLQSMMPGKYAVVLSSEKLAGRPDPSYFDTFSLFGTEMTVPGVPGMFMLNAVLMDEDFVDHSSAIEASAQKPIGMIAAGGLEQLDDIPALLEYFETAIQRLDGKAMTPEMMMFGKVVTRPISAILDEMTPRNPFTTVKRYKKDGGDIYYWQMFCNPGNDFDLVMHQGKLGTTGEAGQIKDLSEQQTRETYDGLIREKEAEGFKIWENEISMTLQFPLDDDWGEMEDLDFRHQLEEVLDRHLSWTGNGGVSGGDIGAGTINIFFEVIDPMLCLPAVREAIQEMGGPERPFLVLRVDKDSDENWKETVLYPENYDGPVGV